MKTIELFAALATISSVYALSKGMSYGWVLSVIGCVLYGVFFVEESLFANALLQVVFIGQSIYAAFRWNKHSDNDKHFKCVKMSDTTFFIIMAELMLFLILFSINAFPENIIESEKNLDMFLTVGSLIATVLMILKYLQSWFFWMFVDIGYIVLFCSLELWLSAGLYFILLLLCIRGYSNWSKNITTKIN